MRLILLGSPGSGKGTLATELCKRFPFIHISTGDLFRKHRNEDTPLGREIRSYLAEGKLVPDDVTVRMVKEVLEDPAVLADFLFDGFPRTLNQATIFDAYLKEKQAPIDAAVHVKVPDAVIQERLSGRRICKACGRTYHITSYPTREPGKCDSCGGEVVQREDDKPEVIAYRLQTYHELTSPLETYYRDAGILVELDNTGALPDVLETLCRKLGLTGEA